MGKTININNQKGGVGKTTTALAIASVLTEQGKKVLLIDCDGSSCSLTKNVYKQIIAEVGEENFTVPTTTLTDAVLMHTMDRDGSAILRMAIIHSPKGYDLIPADERLVAVAMNLALQNKIETRYYTLETLLKTVKNDYDFIILDSAPVFDIFSINQLIASDELLIVTQTQKASTDAVHEILRSVEELIIPQKPQFSILGVLPTMLDKREGYSKKTLENFKESLTDVYVFNTTIPYGVQAKRCVDSGKAITEFDKTSKIAEAYRDFVKEWSERTWNNS